MITSRRAFLVRLFDAAVAAAHPAQCLPAHLPPPPAAGRLVILAAGKAAGAMTEVTEQYYLAHDFPAARIAGLAVTRHGYARPTRIVRVIEAGHPVPDAAGLAAAFETLSLADNAGADDLVLALISGGASANWIAPAPGISLEEKRALTRALLKSGASIGEINTVRKHLSRIKGGRLAQRAQPAQLVTIAISDVPGDDPAVIGSGPTVPDPTTLAEARAILERYRLDLPPATRARWPIRTTRRRSPGIPPSLEPRSCWRHGRRTCLPRLGGWCGQRDSNASSWAPPLRARRVRSRPSTPGSPKTSRRRAGGPSSSRAGNLPLRCAERGGEGPNQEYALALMLALAGAPGIAALAGDTDGTDGGAGRSDDPAGAYFDENTPEQAQKLGLDPAVFLADNNSSEFFGKLGDLLTPGPTYTNVNDFRAILVDSA